MLFQKLYKFNAFHNINNHSPWSVRDSYSKLKTQQLEYLPFTIVNK